MSRLKIVLGILAALILAQGVALFLFGILLYQSTPHSVLARDTFIGRIPGVLATVRILDRAANVFYWGPSPPAQVPQYALRVDPKDLRKVEEALPQSVPSPWYSNVFLTEEAKVWIPATFIAGNESYDVKIRVRGDIFNHWAYRKKSWRVKFQSEKLFQGKREINLIIPEDREWFAELLNAHRAKKLGLLYAPMQFVTVSLNGSGPMLYTEVEHWDKEMLEKQARPGDVNIYGADGGTSRFQQWDPAFDDVAYWSKYEVNPMRPDSLEEVEQLNLLAQEGAHDRADFLPRLERIMDIDKVVSWHVLALLAGSSHVDTFNLRFFFDTSRGRFEPIPWDISLYSPRSLFELPGNPLLNEIFRVPSIKLAAFRQAWAYVSDDENVRSDLETADRLRALGERRAYRDNVKLQSNRQVKAALDRNERNVRANIEHLRSELSICETLITQRIPEARQQNRGVALVLDITARGVSPALLSAIKFPAEYRPLLEEGRIELWRDNGNGGWGEDDTRVAAALQPEPDDNGLLSLTTTDESSSLLWTGDPEIEKGSGQLGPPHTRHRFFVIVRDEPIIADDAYPFAIDVRNAVTTEPATVLRDVLVDDRSFERLPESWLSKNDFLAAYPFFRPGDDNVVILRGNHVIETTVIVPSGLRLVVEPGAIIRMGPGASIFSYAPVTMEGTDTAPIQILPLRPGEPWGVFAVLNADGASSVRWLQASGGGEALFHNVYVTGMIAFHGSPVTVADSIFREATGDDALNIKYVYADVRRSLFERNVSDAIDIDVPPAGTVENVIFRANGGDGLDLSWAPIIVRNIEVDGSGDKCISVGERSTPLIYDSVLRGCNYGIAVKDDSHAKIERVTFEDNNIAISGYIKKQIFGPPSATVNESTFLRNKVKLETLSGAVITVDSAE